LLNHNTQVHTFCLHLLLLVTAAVLATGQLPARAQSDFQQAPIKYDATKATDAIAKLAVQLDSGERRLSWDPQHGWLPALLDALNVPASSQTLVFSKTSMQIESISPRNPRALYFNDNVYIGAVPGADWIELSAVDPELGAVFYTLDARPDAIRESDAPNETQLKVPKIIRDQTECLRCHHTGKTQNVPGYLIRSVYPKRSGHPRYELGTTTTDHTTPLIDRFGGWFVTGSHGTMRHRGNAFATSDSDAPIDFEHGANQFQLPKRLHAKNYIHTGSDIVALMVLEHQSQMHNAITRAAYETRMAYHYQDVLNRALDRPADFVSDSTRRRMQKAGDELLKHLLFANEAKLTDQITGDPAFVEDFQANAKRDEEGRSLRDFDLKTRMFKHPCSYLIHSEAFESLPPQVLSYVQQRLIAILTGGDNDEAFEHLGETDRSNILTILTATTPRFADKLKK
jgi:hypothetical protein